MKKIEVRKQEEYVPLSRDEFQRRFTERFYDPAFDAVRKEIDRLSEVAWDGYIKYRKSPRTRPAGEGFSDPSFPLPLEWLEARARIAAAQKRHDDASLASRILVVNGASRSEHSCPGEISKTRRLAQHAQKTFEARGCEVDFLDMAELTDEPLKVIHPCKTCVSTAQPLCHWPCSCYPNHAMGQANDWMNELYPRWAAAHGVFVATPVNWYHTSSSLKLMIDRLVCADGGNPDPTTTKGKDPKLAKKLELDGWPYPRHLAGRAFAVVTHGDAAGPEELRRQLSDWLSEMGLVQAGGMASQDLWIGYYEPYATSHESLDADTDVFVDVENAAHSLCNAVEALRAGWKPFDAGLREPKPK
ncbi:MAG: flavodoxin family protein [Betaproteobacteria bacterium]